MALLKLDAEGDGAAFVATVRTSNASYRAVFSRPMHSRIYLRSKAIYIRGRFVLPFWVIDTRGDCCSGATTSPVPELMAFAGVTSRKTPVWHGYYNLCEANRPVYTLRFLNAAVTDVKTGA